MEITDTAGQDQFSTPKERWIREADGLLILFDVNKKESFYELESLMEYIAEINPSAPKILFGNKSKFFALKGFFLALLNILLALVDDTSKRREVDTKQAKKFGQSSFCLDYLEGSALKNVNVQEAFHRLILEVDNARSFPPKKQRKKCCIF